MSTEKDTQRGMLKLLACGTLANLSKNLGTEEAIAPEEVEGLLGVQEALIS